MKKIKNIFCLLVMVFGVSSCSLFEPEMDNVYFDDRLTTDPAFTEGLLMNAYAALPNDYDFDDVATDDAVTNDKNSNYLRMAIGGWTSVFNPMDEWTEKYYQIFYLNKFLSVVDKVKWSWESPYRDSLFKARHKGGALALRGYFHYLVLMKHGGKDASGNILGIPVVKEVLEPNSDWKLSRPPFNESVQAILADLDSAAKYLPFDFADIPTDGDYSRVNGIKQKGLITGKIVQAIKARVALILSSPAFHNGDYNTLLCETAALCVENVIGTTKLPTTGLNFFDDDNDISNTEVIWRNDFTSLNSWEQENYPPSLYGRGEVNPTQNLVDVFPMKNGKPIIDPTSGYVASAPYINRDPRLAAYIVYNGNKIGTRTINTNKESVQDGLNNTTASTRTGYYLKKLLRPDVTLTPGSVNTRRHFKPHIRFTELYLIYAEAANESWGPDADPKGYGLTARAAIAEIRKRAGIDAADTYLASITTKEEMRKLIRNERRLELCFEGTRFWDIRRWGLPLNETAKGISIVNGTYSVIDVENRAFTPDMQFGPVPYTETLKNPSLVQNKGW